MKYTKTNIGQSVNILANDHFVAISYDCSKLSAKAKDGVIPAGTIVPANDTTAVGVLLNDVYINENPNGAVIIHGFIDKNNLPEAPDTEAEKALKGVFFVPFAPGE